MSSIRTPVRSATGVLRWSTPKRRGSAQSRRTRASCAATAPASYSGSATGGMAMTSTCRRCHPTARGASPSSATTRSQPSGRRPTADGRSFSIRTSRSVRPVFRRDPAGRRSWSRRTMSVSNAAELVSHQRVADVRLADVVDGRQPHQVPFGADGRGFSSDSDAALRAWAGAHSEEMAKGPPQFVTRVEAAASGYTVDPARRAGVKASITRMVGDPPAELSSDVVLHHVGSELKRLSGTPAQAPLQSKLRDPGAVSLQAADIRAAFQSATGKEAGEDFRAPTLTRFRTGRCSPNSCPPRCKRPTGGLTCWPSGRRLLMLPTGSVFASRSRRRRLRIAVAGPRASRIRECRGSFPSRCPPFRARSSGSSRRRGNLVLGTPAVGVPADDRHRSFIARGYPVDGRFIDP